MNEHTEDSYAEWHTRKKFMNFLSKWRKIYIYMINEPYFRAAFLAATGTADIDFWFRFCYWSVVILYVFNLFLFSSTNFDTLHNEIRRNTICKWIFFLHKNAEDFFLFSIYLANWRWNIVHNGLFCYDFSWLLCKWFHLFLNALWNEFFFV